MPRHATPTRTIIVASTVEQAQRLRAKYGARNSTEAFSSATIRLATYGKDLSGYRVIICAALWHEPGMPQLLSTRNCKEVLVVL